MTCQFFFGISRCHVWLHFAGGCVGFYAEPSGDDDNDMDQYCRCLKIWYHKLPRFKSLNSAIFCPWTLAEKLAEVRKYVVKPRFQTNSCHLGCVCCQLKLSEVRWKSLPVRGFRNLSIGGAGSALLWSTGAQLGRSQALFLMLRTRIRRASKSLDPFRIFQVIQAMSGCFS